MRGLVIIGAAIGVGLAVEVKSAILGDGADDDDEWEVVDSSEKIPSCSMQTALKLSEEQMVAVMRHGQVFENLRESVFSEKVWLEIFDRANDLYHNDLRRDDKVFESKEFLDSVLRSGGSSQIDAMLFRDVIFHYFEHRRTCAKDSMIAPPVFLYFFEALEKAPDFDVTSALKLKGVVNELIRRFVIVHSLEGEFNQPDRREGAFHDFCKVWRTLIAGVLSPMSLKHGNANHLNSFLDSAVLPAQKRENLPSVLTREEVDLMFFFQSVMAENFKVWLYFGAGWDMRGDIRKTELAKLLDEFPAVRQSIGVGWAKQAWNALPGERDGLLSDARQNVQTIKAVYDQWSKQQDNA